MLIVDLNDEEASFLLVTLDPLAEMAGVDGEALNALLHEAQSGEEGVQAMIEEITRLVSAGTVYTVVGPVATCAGPMRRLGVRAIDYCPLKIDHVPSEFFRSTNTFGSVKAANPGLTNVIVTLRSVESCARIESAGMTSEVAPTVTISAFCTSYDIGLLPPHHWYNRSGRAAAPKC